MNCPAVVKRRIDPGGLFQASGPLMNAYEISFSSSSQALSRQDEGVIRRDRGKHVCVVKNHDYLLCTIVNVRRGGRVVSVSASESVPDTGGVT